jgi:hypothetical protein
MPKACLIHYLYVSNYHYLTLSHGYCLHIIIIGLVFMRVCVLHTFPVLEPSLSKNGLSFISVSPYKNKRNLILF